ncbi:transposase [Neolewinella antarctica]|uniref:REP element-mobilizing transposase RayT n=1 Tax=Neolewinella antarctica TaxID=442734 RepID=A0ABX0XEM5_9BACT|nr:transposase [Neolewinella antarctica]NJC27750.1 REP element-mobilizing transposase RayT [Neolewinella antarctica]
MPQAPRPVIRPNAYYHIYNRGVNRRTIFRKDSDFLHFLMLCDKYLAQAGQLLSYALMRDHFHLTVLMNPAADIPPKLLRTEHTLGRTFGHLQNAYANYFNFKYGTVSGLFEARFERKEVDSLRYLLDLIVYQHRNPRKHGVVDDYRSYFWTSYQEFANPLVTCHVAKELTLAKFGGPQAFFAAHDTEVPFAMANFEFAFEV